MSLSNHRYKTIQSFSENVILVTLPKETKQINGVLTELNEKVAAKVERDVVIDFTIVEMINSSNISNLLILRQFLKDSNRRLILSHVNFPTRCILKLVGVEALFNFADNKHQALEDMKTAH